LAPANAYDCPGKSEIKEHIMELQTYADVIKYLDKSKRKKHLLLGNGFSMAYDSTIFSYNALSKFLETLNDPLLHDIFTAINSNNFETIMQQLDDFSKIAKVFGASSTFVAKIDKASTKLKISLLNAVKELHPEHVFKIPQKKCQACAAFLKPFIENDGYIFSTNYDLLLYWVLMRNGIENSVDGFGRDKESDEYTPFDEADYSELRWGKNKEKQNVHYLHGALPIFDDGVDIIKEEYTSGEYLLTNIKKRLDNNEYPVFVTAGNGNDKLKHIMHNKYLSHCYEAFSEIQGSLVSFGFNFGEYDEHIIDAINKASYFKKGAAGKLYSVYIGVYSKTDYDHIVTIQNKFKCKVNLFDSKTVNVW
jgi:hypothetical protein